MPERQSVQMDPIVPRNRVIEVIRTQLHIACNVERRFTADMIAAQSGVPLRTVQSYMSNQDPREPSLSNALSIAVVVGERSVQAIMAIIGYSASPTEDPSEINPMLIVARALPKMGVIAKAAADGRIDHRERPETTDAADSIIAEMLPLSSQANAA